MERFHIKGNATSPGLNLSPNPDGDWVKAADAQATIAALQAERDTARRRVDELEAREVDVVLLRDDLEQRTAELETVEKILDIDSGKTTVEKVCALHNSFKQVWESYQDASNEMFKAQAELERVRAALERIARYGKDGICPFGCDTPHIAQAALTATSQEGQHG